MKMKRNTKRTIIALGLAASMLMSVGAMSVSAASEEMVSVPESVQQSPQTEEGLEILTKDMETGEEYVEVVPPTPDEEMLPPSNDYCFPDLEAPTFNPTRPNSLLFEDRWEVGQGDINKYVKALCFIECKFPNDSRVHRGTGFVVGNGVVVTAAHVINQKNKQTGQYQYATQVTIYPQRKENVTPLGSYQATKLHVTNQYVKYSGDDGQQALDQDIGIIEVGTNLEAKTGKYNLKYIDNPTTTWANSQTFTVAGYPHSLKGSNTEIIKQYAMEGKGECTISSVVRDGNKFWTLQNTKIDVSEGQSGSAYHTTGYSVYAIVAQRNSPKEKPSLNGGKGPIINKIFYNWINQYI